MDITPTNMGADLDVTDEAMPALADFLAIAFAEREQYVSVLIAELADAIAQRDGLAARKHPERFYEAIAEAELVVDGARDALVAALSKGRVTISLTSAGCRADGELLTAAAEQADARHRPALMLLPHQQDRSAA